MQIRGRDIGVCSWSLRAVGVEELIAGVRETGLSHVQLDINPYLDNPAAAATMAKRLEQEGITVTAGMVGFPGESYITIETIKQTGGFLPDDLAEQRVARAIAAARIARETFGLKAISAHAGFLPPADAANYRAVQQRIHTVADALAKLEMTLLFETGQESAEHLKFFLDDLQRPNVRANFDPGNMILYGAGDPLAAVRTLGSRIGHVHVKDAIASSKPGVEWGTEMAPGNGQINWSAFLDALDAVGYHGPLVIEREAGESRIADIRFGVETLKRA